MAATVYTIPDGFKAPKFSLTETTEQRLANEQKFIDDLAKWCKERNPTQKHIGEVIKFPVADGYALYMVAAISPIQLLHLPLGDAWQFQYATRLTKKDIIQQIEGEKKLAELFGSKKK